MGFSGEVVKTIEWAQATGFEYGGTGGDGHPVLIWRDGTRVNISGTTKNWNTVQNDRQRLARLSGEHFGTRRAGKFRKGVSGRHSGGPRSGVRASGARADALRAYIANCEAQRKTAARLPLGARDALRKAKVELAELDRIAKKSLG